MECKGKRYPAWRRVMPALKPEDFQRALESAPALSALVGGAARKDYEALVQAAAFDPLADAQVEGPRVVEAFRSWLAEKLLPERRADVALHMNLQIVDLSCKVPLSTPATLALGQLAGGVWCEIEDYETIHDILLQFDKNQPGVAALVQDYVAGRLFPNDGHAGVGGHGEAVD